MKCLQCGTEMKVGRENHRYESGGLPYITLVDVEVRRCPNCGEWEVSIPYIEDLHGALADYLARKKAKLTKEEIRFLRTYLGLSGVELAERMGVSPSTVSRWENGSKPMGLTSERLLRLLVAFGHPRSEGVREEIGKTAKIKSAPLRAMLVEQDGHWNSQAA